MQQSEVACSFLFQWHICRKFQESYNLIWEVWMKENVLITRDSKGNKLVVLPQIIFSGKQSISWDEVENYLVRYAGKLCEVAETKDIIYIGKEFSDEYAHSSYTKNLKGGVAKAKANLVQGIPELIEIATDKRWSEDYEKRHKKKAEKGWYRYNTQFALPVTDNLGKIVRYNTYRAVLIVRYAANGKLYLYDILNIKKETSKPL